MNYLTSYKKGWQSAENWRLFVQGMADKDCTAIGNAVALEGAKRKPVDCYVGSLIGQEFAGRFIDDQASSDVGSEEFDNEQKFVHELVGMRDTPLEQLAVTLPAGLRQLSVFLQDIEVPNRKNVDFMKSDKEFRNIQKGNLPREMITVRGTTTIKTLRDLATYVHTDCPHEQWHRVIDVLLAQGITQNLPPMLHDGDEEGQARFGCWGAPYLKGVVSMTINRVCIHSFQSKWKRMKPRPEEYAMTAGFGLLPQCYPEGSPMHPSEDAMHSVAAHAGAATIQELFQKRALMDHGVSVELETSLFADNIGMGRFGAGVHRMQDHVSCKKGAAKLAQNVVRGFMQR